MNPSESPSEESSLNRDATWRTGGDEGVEIGRETVKFAGTETVNVCRHVNTSVVAEGEVSEGGPTDKPVAVRPLAGPREIPGCVCPECGKPAAIHGGIASDFLYQVVLAEIGRRGVEIVCEGCRHRFVFGAAPVFQDRTRRDDPPRPVEQS